MEFADIFLLDLEWLCTAVRAVQAVASCCELDMLGVLL
jgi:hypothetical protein